MCENSHDQDKSEFVSELTVLLQSLVDEGQANNPHEARLAEFFSNQPSFSKFSGTGVIISFARGGYALDFRSLAFSLLRHASDSTPEHAVEDIQWFLETSSFPVKQSIFISGISIPEAIEMGGGIHLEPFSSIEEGANHLIPIGPSGEGLEMNIGAVLWRKIDYPKILEGPSGDAIEPDVWDFSALEDARLCLTLAGPSGPTKIGSSIFIEALD